MLALAGDFPQRVYADTVFLFFALFFGAIV